MQRYKLIELKTRKEHLCDKVTIDGFDYYVSDKKEQVVLNKYYYEYDNHVPIYSFTKQTLPNQYYLSQVISTNNPNIDIPQVVDEVEILAKNYCEYWEFKKIFGNGFNGLAHDSFAEGYNKSQETHPFSEENMIEFGYWLLNDEDKPPFTNESKKELLQLWRYQRPKIVYFE